MNDIEQAKQTTADLFRMAITNRDSEAFKRVLSTPTVIESDDTAQAPMGFYSTEYDHSAMLYELVKEDPTRDTLAFVHSHCWTQNLLRDFAVKEIYSYLTNSTFKPTILECFRDTSYSIQEPFDNTNLDSEDLIPERLESFVEEFKSILDNDAMSNLVERVNSYFIPELTEIPLIEWILCLHEKEITGSNYVQWLESVYAQDKLRAFAIVSQSKIVLTKKQRKQVMHKEILKWFDNRDLNKRLNQKLQPKIKSSLAKI